MSILHQIQHSNLEGSALTCCLRYISCNDQIILVGNGVNTVLNANGKKLLDGRSFALLEDDVKARGLLKYCQDMTLVDYDEFVALTLKHDKVISW